MIEIKNPKLRSFIGKAVPFVLIPAAAILGTLLFDEKIIPFVTLLVTVLTVCLFLSGFDKKTVGSRRLVIVAVMTALCIVGRFIPLFKPVTALTVIGAVYLGRESGFAIGAFAALLSNFYFGQGPWTPFQMLAWGLIGYFAGALSKILRQSRPAMVIYAAVSGALFSAVMDVWTVLWHGDGFSPRLYLAAIVTALPHTTLYLISNVIFMIIVAKPFGQKLERIRIKYGV